MKWAESLILVKEGHFRLNRGKRLKPWPRTSVLLSVCQRSVGNWGATRPLFSPHIKHIATIPSNTLQRETVMGLRHALMDAMLS